MKRISIVAVVVAILAAAWLAASAVAGDKVTICHAAGLADTTHYVTLTISENAVYGPGGHFNENGTPQAGHEQDYLGACETDDTTPTDTTPTDTTPTDPTAPSCTFVGADKDGGVDAYGGTNDDCAPAATPAAATPVAPCPVVEKVVQAPPVVITIVKKGKTKVVTKVKTKVVYVTKVKVKYVKVYVPGLHKNGVEGSG